MSKKKLTTDKKAKEKFKKIVKLKGAYDITVIISIAILLFFRVIGLTIVWMVIPLVVLIFALIQSKKIWKCPNCMTSLPTKVPRKKINFCLECESELK